MKRQKLSEWLEETFVNPPVPATARAMCERGDIPSVKIGTRWWVLVGDTPKTSTKRDARLNKIMNG